MASNKSAMTSPATAEIESTRCGCCDLKKEYIEAYIGHVRRRMEVDEFVGYAAKLLKTRLTCRKRKKLK